MAQLVHSAQRAAYNVAIRQAIKYVKKDGADKYEQIGKLIDLVERLTGSNYPPEGYAKARQLLANPDEKWARFLARSLDELDDNVIATTLLNLGFETFIEGTKQIRENRKKYDCNIPWLILFDPTSACNLRCTGCWAAEYGHKLNLTYDEMSKLVSEGKELGTHLFLLTGGEPMVRKKDILRLAEEHNDCMYHIFTNGTLIDEEFCREAQRLGNIAFGISLEGFEEVNDGRRGAGVFDKVMKAFDLLKQYGLLFGVSICYTRANIATAATRGISTTCRSATMRMRTFSRRWTRESTCCTGSVRSVTTRCCLHLTSRMTASLSAAASPAAETTSMSTRTGMWSRACSFIFQMPTSGRRASLSA